MESQPRQTELFKKPDFIDELGEFKRVADVFGVDESVLLFLAEEGKMEYLSDEVWSKLENTDSFSIKEGDWAGVEAHSSAHTPRRDWEVIKHGIESNEQVPAPIIVKKGDVYHLVSGNTRLMVCRTLGVVPRVWLFEIN
jgi:hypothetical protein